MQKFSCDFVRHLLHDCSNLSFYSLQVRDNLFFTKDNCNGIESYCLYYVLSLCDYLAATNDTQTGFKKQLSTEALNLNPKPKS